MRVDKKIIVVNGQRLKNNPAIWSHCIEATERMNHCAHFKKNSAMNVMTFPSEPSA